MRKLCFGFAAHSLALVLLTLSNSVALSDVFTLNVDNSADNSFSFTVVPLAAVSDVANLSGTVVVDVTTVGKDVTSITFLSADISIDDVTISQAVNFFGAFPGTLGITFTNTRFGINGGPFPVTGGAFDPTGLSFVFDQGTLDIAIDSAITGAINAQVDYDANPQTVTFGFSSNQGNVLFDGTNLSLFLPMDVASESVPVDQFNIFLAINASLSGSTAIPEASSLLMITGTIFSVGLIRRFQRSK